MDRDGPSIYRYCLAALLDRRLADKLYQQISLTAGRGLAAFDRRLTLRTWLFAIARLRVLKAAASQRRRRCRVVEQIVHMSAPSGVAGGTLDDAGLREALASCLCELDVRAQAAVLLRYQQGFTFDEMAEICHEKPDKLQARIARALRELRNRIEARTARVLLNNPANHPISRIEVALQELCVDDKLRARETVNHGSSKGSLPGTLLGLWRGPWIVSVASTLVYGFLAVTNVDLYWKAIGLNLLLLPWTFTLADLFESKRIARTRGFLVARAFAHQLRGEFTEALDALDNVKMRVCRPMEPDLQLLAWTIRIGALVELDRPAEARSQLATAPDTRRAPTLRWLAEGQIAWHSDELDVASQRFADVIGDICAGSKIRAIAHVYAARIFDARGETIVAAHHRAAAASLAPPEATWLRPPP